MEKLLKKLELVYGKNYFLRKAERYMSNKADKEN